MIWYERERRRRSAHIYIHEHQKKRMSENILSARIRILCARVWVFLLRGYNKASAVCTHPLVIHLYKGCIFILRGYVGAAAAPLVGRDTYRLVINVYASTTLLLLPFPNIPRFSLILPHPRSTYNSLALPRRAEDFWNYAKTFPDNGSHIYVTHPPHELHSIELDKTFGINIEFHNWLY